MANHILQGSGADRLWRLVHGDVPRIKTIGIMTASNPIGHMLSADENEHRNVRLANLLNDGNLGFIQISGRYGYFEDPSLALNVYVESFLSSAGHRSYNQEYVIYAKVEKNTGAIFNFVENGTITGSRSITVLKNGGTREFTEASTGRGFIIPFFDDPAEPLHGAGGILSHQAIVAEVLRTNLGDPNKPTFTLEEMQILNNTGELQNDMERIEAYNTVDHAVAAGFGNWGCRGMARQTMDRMYQRFGELN